MPVLGIPLDEFRDLLRHPISDEQLENELHRFGCSVEGWTTTCRFRCRACSAISEAGDGESPLACEGCGLDFRQPGHEPEAAGDVRVLRMELLAVRPDLFDPAGLARAMRGFLGHESGAPRYRVERGAVSIDVDGPVAVRPRISAAVVRGLRLDDARLRSLMKLQENIHWALGRDRKLASIGVYDFSTVPSGDLVYRSTRPDENAFVPLGYDPEAPGAKLTPAEILARHPKGTAFSRLLQGIEEFPLLCDGEGGVLSMPPIINSEHTRITTSTTDAVIDVTGLEDRHVDRALNIVVTSLLEACPESYAESVTIRYADGGTRDTPDMHPQEMLLNVKSAGKTIGVDWTAQELIEVLQRMRHDVDTLDDGDLRVHVPPWRADIMHPRDLMEDAAIAHGYDRIERHELGSATYAAPLPSLEWSATARFVLAGLGYLEVMTLALTSEEATYDRTGLINRDSHVRLSNPISTEQTMLRVSLVPGILDTLAVNLGHPYPQKIFEVGSVVMHDDSSETGALESERAAFALAGDGLGFADIRSAVDLLLAELTGGEGGSFDYEPLDEPLFLDGRGASALIGQRCVARLGEVSPAVLERFRIIHPVVLAEVDLAALRSAS